MIHKDNTDTHAQTIWLKLLLTPGLGSIRLQQLYQHYSCASNIDQAIMAGECRLPEAAANAYKRPDQQRLDAHLEWLSAPQHHFICLEDQHYPQLLRDINGAPPVLFVNGDIEALWQPQVAIVGSRNPSRNGLDVAAEIATALTKAGLTITSGLAHGIDAIAHRNSLKNGRTIAVMGTGADRIYPARHRDLAQEIIDNNGALITEFNLGTEPKPGHFPARNRIISGLSIATVVIEAGLKSGSLITARLAAEQGRDVLAVPGSIRNPTSRGCHRLIRDGARLIENAEQLLEDIAASAGRLAGQLESDELIVSGLPELISTNKDQNQTNGSETEPLADNLDAQQQQLFALLDVTPVNIDWLVEQQPFKTRLTPEQISSMLLLLELDGLVANTTGGWVKC